MESGDLVIAKGSHGVGVYHYDNKGFWVWNGTIASAFQLHVYLCKVPHVKHGRLSYFLSTIDLKIRVCREYAFVKIEP